MQQIADIIEYEGNNNSFVWKHPTEDFNSLTQLIVHETQEALFFRNGQALDLFGPGRYTLETQNIPKIGKLLNRITGDRTPFHCEVYFINKTEHMAIKWGTDTKVQYMEPKYGFPISIGACGEMSIRAEDSRKLLIKLVGTETDLNRAKLVDYFRAFLMTRVKSYIAQMMKINAISIFEIDENLTAFSEGIHKLLIPDFADYGVALEKFLITSVVKPDGEKQYEQFKQLHFRQYADVLDAQLRSQVSVIEAQTEAQKTIIQSQAMATKRAQEGYTYQQERTYNVMDEVAKIGGSGSDLTNAAMGIGMGFGVAGTFGKAMNSLSSSIVNNVSDYTVNVPIAPTPDVNLLKETEQKKDFSEGNGQAAEMDMFKNKLEKLVMMKEKGILTDEEFSEQKALLLSKL